MEKVNRNFTGMYGEFNVNFQSYADVILCDGKLITLSIQNMYDVIDENEVKIISAECGLNKIKTKVYGHYYRAKKQKPTEQIWFRLMLQFRNEIVKVRRCHFWKLYWCFFEKR